MKFINIYTGAALALTGTIIISLAIATGEAEPPATIGALIFMVLALGRAGGAESALSELDRLTRIEGARGIQAQCHATERDNLEAEIDRLRAQIKDGQAAIEIVSASAGISALLGEVSGNRLANLK